MKIKTLFFFFFEQKSKYSINPEDLEKEQENGFDSIKKRWFNVTNNSRNLNDNCIKDLKKIMKFYFLLPQTITYY